MSLQPFEILANCHICKTPTIHTITFVSIDVLEKKVYCRLKCEQCQKEYVCFTSFEGWKTIIPKHFEESN